MPEQKTLPKPVLLQELHVQEPKTKRSKRKVLDACKKGGLIIFVALIICGWIIGWIIFGETFLR